jgi:4-hydroxymandelate oxidase
MPQPNPTDTSRRQFLRFLAGSPLLSPSVGAALLAAARSSTRAADRPPGFEDFVPGSAPDAVNVFDLEAAARTRLSAGHYAGLSYGIEGENTLRANRDGFTRFQLRPRRLVDTTTLDTSVTLFGAKWPTPLFLCPAASQRAYHEEGELAVARAARARRHLQIVSTLTSHSLEAINEARGGPVWFQLYPTPDWNITRALLQRAESAGCPVVALTLDNPTNTQRERLLRTRQRDPRICAECHQPGPVAHVLSKPMFAGLDLSRIPTLLTDHLTWDFVRRLRDTTKMKLVLKGIVTAEDAAFALQHGVDGIVVSNHGGRGEESGRSSIESLPEVVAVVDGRVPVLIDSGFRRGTDIFKALALGATAVGVGRPYLWGLGAFGQAGVERCLEILTAELQGAMRYLGAPSLSHITRDRIQRAG